MQLEITQLYGQQPRRQDSNDALDLIKPRLERTETETEYILRWEDDGGKDVQTADLLG